MQEYPLSICGGAVSGPAHTDVSSTDAECGLGCNRFGNVGYGGTHGRAKVAANPGEAGRWAYIRHLREL